jgi:dicarboxylate/amino acid:cation (Na+ or H+) symporter, DAACS family
MALPLHTKVLLGFVLGTAAGIAAYAWARFGGELFAINIIVDYVARPAGALFLNLLFMLVLPLMFSALILGVAELGDIATLGRVGSRTLAYTAIVTAIAVGLGLLLVNLIQPGVAFDPALRESVMAGSSIRSHEIAGAHPALSGVDMLLGIVPRNVLRAAVEDQFLSVMFFALLLGVALVLTPSPATTAFKAAIQGLNELVMKLIGLVVRLTPYAVACLMFALSARFGWDLLLTLGRFVFTVLLAIALHMFVVLPLWVQFKGGMSPAFFFRGSQEAILTAFSTASSAGTLPTTLRVAEQNLRLPAHVARFVLTIGASANHHGTALFEGLTTLFLAQCFGVTLDLIQQASLLVLCILASIGTAGVPAGSLPVIAMLLGYLQVPPDAIGLILGVDRLLDMCRTALNVTGDLATAVVVARSEEIAGPAPRPHALLDPAYEPDG